MHHRAENLKVRRPARGTLGRGTYARTTPESALNGPLRTRLVLMALDEVEVLRSSIHKIRTFPRVTLSLPASRVLACTS